MNAHPLPHNVRWAPVGFFLVASFLLAWLVCLPLWIDARGLASPATAWVLPMVMFTPLLATTLTTLTFDRGTLGAQVRRLGMWPLEPATRTIVLTVAAVVFLPLLVAAGLATSAWLGLVQLDLDEFSGFAAALPENVSRAVPVRTLVIVQLVSIPIAAVLNGFLAFGEEIGWRGWLLPELQPLGNWPAVLLTGAVWGAWHAPLILLGYNFDQPNSLGVVAMIAGCTAVGVVIGWSRIWSTSVWPAVFGHGSLNAAGGLVVLLSSDESAPNLLLAGPVGAGTVVAVVVVSLLGILVRRTTGRSPGWFPRKYR